MSYFCPNCGGWKYSFPGIAAAAFDQVKKAEHFGRTSKKKRLDVYWCYICQKTYLIHVLEE